MLRHLRSTCAGDSEWSIHLPKKQCVIGRGTANLAREETSPAASSIFSNTPQARPATPPQTSKPTGTQQSGEISYHAMLCIAGQDLTAASAFYFVQGRVNSHRGYRVLPALLRARATSLRTPAPAPIPRPGDVVIARSRPRRGRAAATTTTTTTPPSPGAPRPFAPGAPPPFSVLAVPIPPPAAVAITVGVVVATTTSLIAVR